MNELGCQSCGQHHVMVVLGLHPVEQDWKCGVCGKLQKGGKLVYHQEPSGSRRKNPEPQVIRTTAQPPGDQTLIKSIGDILKGDPSKSGLRYVSSAGATYTVKSTEDPNVPGGKFVSVTNESGSKRTIVYDRNGNVAKDSGWQ